MYPTGYIGSSECLCFSAPALLSTQCFPGPPAVQDLESGRPVAFGSLQENTYVSDTASNNRVWPYFNLCDGSPILRVTSSDLSGAVSSPYPTPDQPMGGMPSAEVPSILATELDGSSTGPSPGAPDGGGT